MDNAIFPNKFKAALAAAVMEMMQALRADGLGTADHSALACYYEKLAKVEVTR